MSLFLGSATLYAVDYNDGGTHNLTANPNQNVNISNGTTLPQRDIMTVLVLHTVHFFFSRI
ncbi:MAG: hypothetical protein Q4C70_12990 [Planctomycetia bacterium]|nr:hypothetical protein [Planctomycetia bacterium]